ncbi:MAG TPA: hypothetical protein VFY71_16810 [Planctomycetota bacterium]|nr:hypothetical protein [Planctomycetota bacterium]
MGTQLDHFVPLVRQRIGGSAAVRPEIWVMAELPADNESGGMTSRQSGRILLRTAREPDQSFFLAHELVHLLRGSDLDGLPPAIEEGLCDAIAADLVPEAAAHLHAARGIGIAAANGSLPVTLMLGSPGLRTSLQLVATAPPLSWENALTADSLGADGMRTRETEVRGVGYIVTQRILGSRGIDGLREIAARVKKDDLDRVAAGEFLRAAGFDGSPEDRIGAASDLLGKEEIPYVPGLLTKEIAAALVRECRPLCEGLTSDECLDRLQPVLQVGALYEPIRLTDGPQLREALRGIWE